MDPLLPPPPAPVRCWSCGYAVEAKDRYCRWCGQGQGAYVVWYYHRWGIAVATVLGLGPFGLVLVRKTPLLSTMEKWVWAAGIVALTAWGCWRFYMAFKMMMGLLGMGTPTF